MSQLHTLNKACFEHSAVQDCLKALADGDALILLEDGVYLTDKFDSALKGRNITLHVVQYDAAARGLHPQNAAFIDARQFVTLCCEYNKTLSWY